MPQVNGIAPWQETQYIAGSVDMGKDSFLQLLVAQLQNQDPLSPMEDKEFIAQLAQFSSLEQLQNMNCSLSAFLDLNLVHQASILIGREVRVYGEDEDIVGLISEVRFTPHGPMIVIDDVEYPMTHIIGIS